MIDLEEALAPLVERAPAPPPVDSVARRGRHHRRRHGHARRRDRTGRSRRRRHDRDGRGSRRATRRDRARRGRARAGHAARRFAARHQRPGVARPERPFDVVQRRARLHGRCAARIQPQPLALGDAYLPARHLQHRSSALPDRGRPRARGPPGFRGPVLAYVEYPAWILGVDWNEEQAYWAAFAHAVQASPNAAGFLVIEAPFGWRLGPTDSPDVQLGDYAFSGPRTHVAPTNRCTWTARCNADATVMTRRARPHARRHAGRHQGRITRRSADDAVEL